MHISDIYVKALTISGDIITSITVLHSVSILLFNVRSTKDNLIPV